MSRSPEGRAHRYAAEGGRDEAGGSALERVSDRLFGGSVHLVDSDLDADELRRMRDLLASGPS